MDNENTNLIKISSGLLAALNSQLSIDVLPREILVLECIIAGTSFRDLSKVEKELKNRIRIEIKREKDNQHDAFAVALYFNKNKIGYLPKTRNETIARLLDAGKQFYAILQAKEWEGTWLKLEAQIYMKD